jgi:hypothetical protein
MTTFEGATQSANTGDRRPVETSTSVSPEALVARHVESARSQLAEARERLKAARRRVVQLEDALTSWERLAEEMRSEQRRRPR